MSKQPSLFKFMSRSENESNKMASGDDVSVPAKTVGKFKFNTKSTRTQPKSDTIENRTVNTIKSTVNNVANLSTASNSSDCVLISDDEHGFSTAKSILAKQDDFEDDIFAEYDTTDLVFTKPTKTPKEAICMEDLYAKYGTPEKKGKNAIDTFDIDKQLNSNASYVTAMKKLDENMQQLRASPKKATVGSKFKFNTRSKPATATATATSQNTTMSSSSTSASFGATLSTTSSSWKSGFESNTNTTKSSVIASGMNSINANKTLNSTNSFATPITPLSGNASINTSQNSLKNMSVSNPYKPVPISSSNGNSSKITSSKIDNS